MDTQKVVFVNFSKSAWGNVIFSRRTLSIIEKKGCCK